MPTCPLISAPLALWGACNTWPSVNDTTYITQLIADGSVHPKKIVFQNRRFERKLKQKRVLCWHSDTISDCLSVNSTQQLHRTRVVGIDERKYIPQFFILVIKSKPDRYTVTKEFYRHTPNFAKRHRRCFLSATRLRITKSVDAKDKNRF